MFKRLSIFIYGILCYAVFLATFLYAVGFVGNFVVPRSIDGPASGDLGGSLIVDLALLLLFALQHSVMARPTFKRWWTRYVPEAAERSTYVLFASLALIALFAFWQPLGGPVWSLQAPAAVYALHGLCALGWLTALASTFMINHFDLFGLRQVWLHLNAVPYRPVGLRTPWPYRVVRHPLYFGFLIAFWATPTMTATHLLFALATTGYILVAIQLEERNLVENLGEPYRNYRRRVPMLIPFTGSKAESGLKNKTASA